MSNRYQSDYQMGHAGAGTQAREIDQGLRKYMLRVYNLMSSAVLLTGIVAYYVAANIQDFAFLYQGGTAWLVMLAPLAFILVLNFGINKLSATAAQGLFWAFAGVMGLSLSSIFLIYTGASIAQTFFVTAGAFAGLSLYGYTTKKDLTAFGTFLVMGLIGLLIASLVNMFMQSSALQFMISLAGVGIFAGLTAYDTQRIKHMYFEGDASDTMTKKATLGALSLYLDFINLFMYLLRFMGNRE